MFCHALASLFHNIVDNSGGSLRTLASTFPFLPSRVLPRLKPLCLQFAECLSPEETPDEPLNAMNSLPLAALTNESYLESEFVAVDSVATAVYVHAGDRLNLQRRFGLFRCRAVLQVKALDLRHELC